MKIKLTGKETFIGKVSIGVDNGNTEKKKPGEEIKLESEPEPIWDKQMLLEQTLDQIKQICLPATYQWIETYRPDLEVELEELEEKIDSFTLSPANFNEFKALLQSYWRWHVKALKLHKDHTKQNESVAEEEASLNPLDRILLSNLSNDPDVKIEPLSDGKVGFIVSNEHSFACEINPHHPLYETVKNKFEFQIKGGDIDMGFPIETEPLVEPGVYNAVIEKVTLHEGKYGNRLQITFLLDGREARVTGFFPTKATASNSTGLLLKKVFGSLEAKDSDELVGKVCRVLVEHKQRGDAVFMNVTKIL